jgi:hypothetical protein
MGQLSLVMLDTLHSASKVAKTIFEFKYSTIRNTWRFLTAQRLANNALPMKNFKTHQIPRRNLKLPFKAFKTTIQASTQPNPQAISPHSFSISSTFMNYPYIFSCLGFIRRFFSLSFVFWFVKCLIKSKDENIYDVRQPPSKDHWKNTLDLDGGKRS